MCELCTSGIGVADHVQLGLPREPGAALEPVEQQEMWSGSFRIDCIEGSAAAQVRNEWHCSQVYSLYASRSYYLEVSSVGENIPAGSAPGHQKGPLCVGVQY